MVGGKAVRNAWHGCHGHHLEGVLTDLCLTLYTSGLIWQSVLSSNILLVYLNLNCIYIDIFCLCGWYERGSGCLFSSCNNNFTLPRCVSWTPTFTSTIRTETSRFWRVITVFLGLTRGSDRGARISYCVINTPASRKCTITVQTCGVIGQWLLQTVRDPRYTLWCDAVIICFVSPFILVNGYQHVGRTCCLLL